MEQQMIILIVKLVILLYLGVNVFLLVAIATKKDSNIKLLAESAINEAIGKTKNYYFSRENLTAMMSKYGFMEMVHDYNMEPSTFLLIKAGLGALGGVACVALLPSVVGKVFGFVVGFLIGFFSLDLILKESNRSDNNEMQDDIITIYSILKAHAKAGVHITDSLIECQRSVSTPRLKKALLELNNTIFAGRATIADAVDNFNARFCNEQIDNLSVIIKQTLRTGRSEEILSDITRQIEDANKLRAQSTEDNLKRKTAFLLAIYFMSISGIALYLVTCQMMASVSKI